MYAMPFDPDQDPVTRARLEPRSRRSDQARAARRRQPRRQLEPRPPGPLERAYDGSTLPLRERVAGRITQLIAMMCERYEAQDRASFDSLVPEFDLLSAWIEDAPDWGITCRLQLFPDFVSDEDMDRV